MADRETSGTNCGEFGQSGFLPEQNKKRTSEVPKLPKQQSELISSPAPSAFLRPLRRSLQRPHAEVVTPLSHRSARHIRQQVRLDGRIVNVIVVDEIAGEPKSSRHRHNKRRWLRESPPLCLDVMLVISGPLDGQQLVQQRSRKVVN